MKHVWCLVLFVVLGLAAPVFAAVQENPFVSIVHRNPFGLKVAARPVPPPPEPSATFPGPLIWLTGITTLSGHSTALFQYEDRQTSKVRYSALLAEGQADDTLQVMHIDLEKASVRVKWRADDLTLDFVRHGLKPKVMPVAPPSAGSRGLAAPNSPTFTPTPPPVTRPALTREQIEELIERRRAELQARETGEPSTVGQAPTRVRR